VEEDEHEEDRLKERHLSPVNGFHYAGSGDLA
jgi:hypothetical protein